MGFLGGHLGYRILKAICPRGDSGHCDGSAYCNRSKLEALFGPDVWKDIAGKVIIDWGCGTGTETIEAAQHGARKAIGLDIRAETLATARTTAERLGLSKRCSFVENTNERADFLFSIDAFEHFDDPARVLRQMRHLLKEDGKAAIAFGPTWYHPLGGHLFSVFPWAHLVFTERSLIRWRSTFKSDGATRFTEVDGGLNQMTIRRFETLVNNSPLRFATFETVPIRRLRYFSHALTREFTTSIVRCTLVPRGSS